MTEKRKDQVWGNHLEESPDKIFVNFCAGRDVQSLPAADADLLPFDILTNAAHSRGLHKIGVMNASELKDVLDGLKKIDSLYRQGKFELKPELEDVHYNIEHYLTSELGIEAAGKIHTGRSRNDQVSTDMRLYLKDFILSFTGKLIKLSETMFERSLKEADSLMPGFTHTQPAMPTTFGHWLQAWGSGILREIDALHNTYEIYDECPLGACAAFGTSWNPDREYVADLLGFSRPTLNTLDTITSRGEFESALTSDLSGLTAKTSGIAQDLIFLSHPYTGFLKLPDRYVSGSSVMPHKRNPDFAEIIRSKASLISGYCQALLGTSKGMLSGYNRDSQQTKYLIMDVIRETAPVPAILEDVIGHMVFDAETAKQKASEDFINTADVADLTCRTLNIPFRTGYNIVARAVGISKGNRLNIDAVKMAFAENGITDVSDDVTEKLIDTQNLILSKTHTGAPSREALEKTYQNAAKTLSEKKSVLNRKADGLSKKYKSLL